MLRIAYVNGRYVPDDAAAVHVEDRGYQFADGVYEVCEVRDGRLVEERRHLARLARSLAALSIASPMAPVSLRVVMREVVRRNRIGDGLVYVQVTRGVAPRNHAFPAPAVAPSVVVTARRIDRAAGTARAEAGIAVITVPDERWRRVDIKTISLLPNVLAKQAASAAGAGEAWFIDGEGKVTEGSSSNAWIVSSDGALVTAKADDGVLRGITRMVVSELVAAEGLRFEERRFSVAEARGAREAFVTSATSLVTPVVRIDGQTVGDGEAWSIAKRLRMLFLSSSEIAPLYARGGDIN